MAIIGTIELLLCDVVLNGITDKNINLNDENLSVSQDISNMLAPFFSGITATAAIVRSVVNIHALAPLLPYRCWYMCDTIAPGAVASALLAADIRHSGHTVIG